MAITSYKAVVGYYNSAGTPSITSAVTAQLSDGWMPVGAPILTDSYGQCTQMMVKADYVGVSTTAYTVVVAANPQPPDATWNAQGAPLWVDTVTYLQAYIKGGAYVGGVLPPSQGGTGVTDLGQLRQAIRVQGVECNDQVSPQSYNSYRSPNGAFTFKVDNSGLVAAITSGSEVVVPFAISAGGTGAVNAYDARLNLGVGRLDEQPSETKLLAPNYSTYIYVNDTDWGCFSPTVGGRIALSVASGGTGATTAAQARTNLGIGSAATYNTVPVANGGTGATTSEQACSNLGALRYNHATSTYYGDEHLYTGIGFYNKDTSPPPAGEGGPYNYAEIMTVAESGGGPGGSGFWSQIAFSTATEQAPRYRQRFAGVSPRISNWRNFLIVDLNTTIDSNGFIKIASPIVKIKGDGTAEFNNESEGCAVTRVSKGVYVVSGCLGLNSDASWGGTNGGFEIPVDINKQPLVWLDYKVLADGSVEIRTYHRTHTNAPDFARNIIDGIADGDPVDIPPSTYVSVRVEMPTTGM